MASQICDPLQKAVASDKKLGTDHRWVDLFEHFDR
jgi:hypothetical protein